MDISSLVQWWQEWQLRILVLSSLGAKCFLALFAVKRKTHMCSISRSAIWLSYLGGDALAIYALATLLNIQKKLQYNSVDRASHDLQVLWAPIMLMHLGGLANISAYNIEDNELWSRHIATAVSQVAIAIYVFCKLWSSSADKRLLAAAILLFVAGIVKCFEKPLALKRASINNLVSPSKDDNNKNKADNDNNLEADDYYNKHRSELDLEVYIQKAVHVVRDPKKARDTFSTGASVESEERRQKERIVSGESQERKQGSPLPSDKLFVDMKYSYDKRLSTLESFWKPHDSKAYYEEICKGLSGTFNLLYTKDFTNDSEDRKDHLFDIAFSFIAWVFGLLLPIPAIGLLHSSKKETYRGTDVHITFVLLYFTLFADIWAIFSLNLSSWNSMVAQHNLIALFARKKKHAWLTSIAKLLRWLDFLKRYYLFLNGSTYVKAEAITGLVCRHVEDGWKNYILDAEDYRKFSDNRGHWTLDLNQCAEALGGSLEMPFDETILHWHLATDFCFHLPTSSDSEKDGNTETKVSHADSDGEISNAREISNYMMHLLFVKPEMLMPGSRRNLCIDAYEEINNIFKGEKSSVKEKQVARKIDEFNSGNGKTAGFIYTAWLLAQKLMKLGEHKMWKVIRGVWIEMLCYHAVRCRGYLHAKSMGTGGEYLSVVWLLMAHAGMETYAERQQRVQLRLPKEMRLQIARTRTMKEEIIEAVRKRKGKEDIEKQRTEEDAAMEVGCALPEVCEDTVLDIY